MNDTPDPFLQDLYDRLHDTPMQRKLRRLAPMPVGAVFIQWPGMGDDDIRAHFRQMKSLGFTCLKGLYVLPGRDRKPIEHMALDEGLVPWWYDDAGGEPITDDLLRRLDIPIDATPQQIRAHPRFIAHQQQILRRRIDGLPLDSQRVDGGLIGDTEIRSEEVPAEVPFSFDGKLDPAAIPHFVAWLRRQYETVEALAEAWNMHHALIDRPDPQWTSWDDVAPKLPKQLARDREYRRLRDVLRFKADVYLASVRRRRDAALAQDPYAPVRAGGEMGLFLPFAARATDMEGIAREMAAGGSFYPSIHLAWHFEEIDFELARPVYMQSSLAHDWAKGIWSATWESTGGPQQLSGGKAHLFPDAAPHTAGFTVDGGTMSILMLSYLAAGFKGFGLWSWNARTAGWEAGEYALVDRQNRPTGRAVVAGRIGQAAQRYRDELWAARKQPLVGILQDWDNDAMWAAVATGGRDHFRHIPQQARIGASRALINANVPWEYVTASNLRAGLAGRYRVIVLPAMLSMSDELLSLLHMYVWSGGRVVADLPGAWYDAFGRLLPTDAGSSFELLFGCTVRDMQYSNPINVARRIGQRGLRGFVADLECTQSQVVETYDNGQPAITDHALGDGHAVFLACEAALACYKPGDRAAEADYVRHILGPHRSPYACDGAIAYRLAAPQADHYFLMNDGPACSARLTFPSLRYSASVDAVTGEAIDLHAPIPLQPHSGRWLRYAK